MYWQLDHHYTLMRYSIVTVIQGVFPPLMEHKLFTFTLLVWKVFRLDSSKTLTQCKLLVQIISLLYLNPKLSLNLAKFFNHSLKGKCFLSLWKLSAVCPLFKNANEHSSPLQYQPIRLLCVISNQEVMDYFSRNNLYYFYFILLMFCF